MATVPRSEPRSEPRSVPRFDGAGVVDARPPVRDSAVAGARPLEDPESDDRTPEPEPEPEPEPADLSKVLEDSGLVLVQTSTAAAGVVESESPVKLGRPRKPKAKEGGEEATLMMVETQK